MGYTFVRTAFLGGKKAATGEKLWLTEHKMAALLGLHAVSVAYASSHPPVLGHRAAGLQPLEVHTKLFLKPVRIRSQGV